MNCFFRLSYSGASAARPRPYVQLFYMCVPKYVAAVARCVAICVGQLFVYGNFMHTGIHFRQRSSIAGASGAHFFSPSPTYLPLYVFRYLTKHKFWILICGKICSTGLSCSAKFSIAHLKRVKRSCCI